MGQFTGPKKWVTKGRDSSYKNYHYKENGYPALFGANNNFYASLINLNNSNISDLSNKSINIPQFRPSLILCKI